MENENHQCFYWLEKRCRWSLNFKINWGRVSMFYYDMNASDDTRVDNTKKFKDVKIKLGPDDTKSKYM